MELNISDLRNAETYCSSSDRSSIDIADDFIDMNIISFERALEKVQSKLQLPKCNGYEEEYTEEKRVILQRNELTDNIVCPSASNHDMKFKKIIHTFRSLPDRWETQQEHINHVFYLKKSYGVNENYDDKRNIIINPILSKSIAPLKKKSVNHIYNYFNKLKVPMKTTSCEKKFTDNKCIELSNTALSPSKHPSSLKQLKLDVFINHSDKLSNSVKESYPVSTKCKNCIFFESKPATFMPILPVKNINSLHLQTESLISPKLISSHSLWYSMTDMNSDKFQHVNPLIFADNKNNTESKCQEISELGCNLLDRDIENALGKYETQLFEVKDAEVQVDLNQTANVIHRCNCLPYHTCEQFQYFKNDKCILKREIIALDLATLTVHPKGKSTILQPCSLREVIRNHTFMVEASDLNNDLGWDLERIGPSSDAKRKSELPMNIDETKQFVRKTALDESSKNCQNENCVGTNDFQHKKPLKKPFSCNSSPLSLLAESIYTQTPLKDDTNSTKNHDKFLGNKNEKIYENLTENLQSSKSDHFNVLNTGRDIPDLGVNLNVNEHLAIIQQHSSEVVNIKSNEDISSCSENEDSEMKKEKNLKRTLPYEERWEDMCTIVRQFGNGKVSPPSMLKKEESHIQLTYLCDSGNQGKGHQQVDIVPVNRNHEEKASFNISNFSVESNIEHVIGHESVSEAMNQRCSKYSDQNVPDIDDIANINTVKEPDGCVPSSGSFHWPPLHSSQVMHSNAMEGCTNKPFERFLSLEGVHKRRRLGLSRTERPARLHPKQQRK